MEKGPREGRRENAQRVSDFLCSQNMGLWAYFWAKDLQGQNSPGRGSSEAGTWGPALWHTCPYPQLLQFPSSELHFQSYLIVPSPSGVSAAETILGLQIGD